MRRLALAIVLSCAAASLAHAHGGLPVSLRILRANGSIYVPVFYWGIWVGGDDKPWTWICEEVINQNKFRRYAVSTDGHSFYATDTRGITRSTDDGCTWSAASGEIAGKRVADVQADPADPAAAWAVTRDGIGTDDDGGTVAPDNALYVTRDRGGTFTRVTGLQAQSARLLSSVRLSPSRPQTIYVTSADPAQASTAVHRSDDGGANFATFSLANQVDGAAPYALEVLAVDPRDEKIVYVRAFATPAGTAREALLRSTDGGASFVELWKQEGVMASSGLTRGIDGVAFDVAQKRVYVATTQGVLAGDDSGGAAAPVLAKTGNLSQAQCVDVSGGAVLACSWNYAPDNAAVARSDDGAQSFRSILRYAETQGPVTYCPKGTPVADQCPLYWQMYGEQLGITFDGGVGDGGGPPPPGGCSCALGGRAAGAAGAAVAFSALLLVLVRRRHLHR